MMVMADLAHGSAEITLSHTSHTGGILIHFVAKLLIARHAKNDTFIIVPFWIPTHRWANDGVLIQ